MGSPLEVAPDRLNLNFTPFAPRAAVEDMVRLPFVMLSNVQNRQAGSATKVVDALSAAKEARERPRTTSTNAAVMARRVGRAIDIPPGGLGSEWLMRAYHRTGYRRCPLPSAGPQRPTRRGRAFGRILRLRCGRRHVPVMRERRSCGRRGAQAVSI